MSGGWKLLAEEIARWRDAGRMVEFWWRDDDAVRADAALLRLSALSARTGVPLALAVIPHCAEPALFEALGATICVLQHGTDHLNRAAAGEKKTEFSATERPEAALERLSAARARLETHAGKRFIPVLAPPWNRLPGHLLPLLRRAGLIGLSRFGDHKMAQPEDHLTQVNTHIDVIDWTGGRGFIGEQASLAAAIRHLSARRGLEAASGGPIGWLTHHAVHDPATWDFLARLFDTTRAMSGVSWRRGEAIFHNI